MSDVDETFKTQTRFLERLDEITRRGRAEWVRSEDDPGFVHCLVDGEDLIEFENVSKKQPMITSLLHPESPREMEQKLRYFAEARSQSMESNNRLASPLLCCHESGRG